MTVSSQSRPPTPVEPEKRHSTRYRYPKPTYPAPDRIVGHFRSVDAEVLDVGIGDLLRRKATLTAPKALHERKINGISDYTGL